MKKAFLINAALFAPLLALGATPETGYITELLTQIQGIVEFLVPLLIALALLFFLYGLVRFLLNSNDEDGRKEARGQMIWGIIALFVIVSVWGLVALLNELTGIEAGGGTAIPNVPSA